MSIAVPTPSPLFADALAHLRTAHAGPVSTPDDAGYDTARAAWNRAFDARPSVVVEPVNAEDVLAALRFAEEAGLDVAVQATGHGLARPSDGALLVATGRLDEVAIDPDTRVARIGAGLPWAPVLAEAQRHGLAPLVGSSPHVGAVGYTLGGGMGWLARKHGLAADTVRAFDLATADGTLRRVSPQAEPELFWALRGGGAGSLGVVTAMEIDLVPVDRVYAGNLLYPVELAGEVLTRFRDWVADVPEELTSAVVLMHYPPMEIVPEPVRGRSFVIVRGCWCGPLGEGAELLRYWRDWRTPEHDLFGPMPFADMAAISQDPVDPLPALVTTDSLGDLGPEVVATLIDHSVPSEGPPLLLFTEVRHAGGALAHPGGGAGRPRLADATFVTHTVGIVDPDAPGTLLSAIEALRSALAPHRREHAYLNFLDGEDRRERVPETFAPDERARLRAVKAAVDPANRFAYGLEL